MNYNNYLNFIENRKLGQKCGLKIVNKRSLTSKLYKDMIRKSHVDPWAYYERTVNLDDAYFESKKSNHEAGNHFTGGIFNLDFTPDG